MDQGCKTKTRLVHHEDDKRVAVPPQFAFIHQDKSALCDRPTSVFAVTGNPVPVYLPTKIMWLSSADLSDDFGVVSLRRLPPFVSFSIRSLDAYYF
jgi:hypothetical protein